MRWDVVTGEYPPQPGGVSDYVAGVCRAIARGGDDVHVWVPPCASSAVPGDGVAVHRLPDRFGPRTLAFLGRSAGPVRSDRRWLVQYTPLAFGWRAMNLPFCAWLSRRGRREPLWTMFHEVVHPFRRQQPLSHNLMAAVTWATAALVARASARIFVSIPAWERLLRRVVPRRRVTWLPVPSTLPTSASPEAVAAVRRGLVTRPGELVVGHFGTFSPLIARMLEEVLPPLLERGPRVGLLVGRGSEDFAASLRRRHPSLTAPVHATGGLAPEAAAAHLAACDVLLQPYPDGISTRRTTAMAGLALGVPIVTTAGALTEPLWTQDETVVLAPAGAPASFVARAEALLSDPAERQRLATRAVGVYEARFALDRTVERLLAPLA